MAEVEKDDVSHYIDNLKVVGIMFLVVCAGPAIFAAFVLCGPLYDEWLAYKADPRPWRMNWDGFGDTVLLSFTFCLLLPFYVLGGCGVGRLREDMECWKYVEPGMMIHD